MYRWVVFTFVVINEMENEVITGYAVTIQPKNEQLYFVVIWNDKSIAENVFNKSPAWQNPQIIKMESVETL